MSDQIERRDFIQGVGILTGVAAAATGLVGSAHFGGALTQAGSPNPRNDRICITSSCPRQFV
jgi:hypothetical protein